MIGFPEYFSIVSSLFQIRRTQFMFPDHYKIRSGLLAVAQFL